MRFEKRFLFHCDSRCPTTRRVLLCTVYWFRVIGRNRLVFVYSENAPCVRERAATVKPRRRAHCSLTIYIIMYSRYLPTTIPLKNICIISLYTIVIKYYILFVRTYTSIRRKRRFDDAASTATTSTLTTATIIIIRHTGSFVNALRAQHNILIYNVCVYNNKFY